MKQQIIERFPGIGCAWRDAAGTITTEYIGLADQESHTAVDENTVFPACSISKFVTAICVMKLHEQKLIDIDRPVNDHLRQWKLLEISLTDILDGKTSYNNRPVRAEKPQGATFEYSDAGYCVLQQLLQEVTYQPLDVMAHEMLFGPLGLGGTFFASPACVARFEARMATGYDDSGLPIPGRFPRVPDLAASGLWSTPKELLALAGEFVKAIGGESSLLQARSALEIAKPVKDFPWTGLGVFTDGEDVLVSRGWSENGQCMLKMNCRTGEISVVMTNRNPGVDQAESGIEWLVNRAFSAR